MRIMIIGAGIGGLTLANSLQTYCPQAEIEIYERDTHFAARTQGYGISLVPKAGLAVLRQLGLFDAVQARANPMGRFTFLTMSGATLLSLNLDGAHTGLSVWRDNLRNTLRGGLKGNIFHFGKKVVSYQQTTRDVTVLLDDGSVATADVVVACDGANSQIRQQMINDAPHYLGLSIIQGVSPGTMAQAQSNTFLTLGVGSSLFVRNAQGAPQIQWGLSLTTEREELASLDRAALKLRAQAHIRRWHAPVPHLIESCKLASLKVRGCYDRHPLHQACDGRVVLLGDAAHPMSPFRGAGANAAMQDALELARLLGQCNADSVDSTLARFAHAMLKRTRPVVLQSRRAAYTYNARGARQRLLRNGMMRVFDFAQRIHSRLAG